METLTSVISVTYHTGPVLDKLIASVLASTVPVELVLVNNGNPPEIEAKLKALADSTPQMKFITGHGNVGFAKGCNLGAKAAKGNFLLFLNPDSMLPPDGVEKLYAEEAKLKPPFMLGARLLDGNGKDQRGCRRALLTPKTAFIEALHLYKFFPKIRLNLHEEPLPETTVPMPAISGAFMFLSTKSFWNINGFNEKHFLHVEDLDFCYRFRQSGGEIYFVPSLVVTHIGGTSSTTNEFLEKQKARGFIRYFHENFNHEYPQPILWALDLAILARMCVKIGIPKLMKKLGFAK
ncbi:MAG: glycosyltransferase family 2 protein [Alphaproteobacteria bacterium]|nr:glycosyltransferase family 2 protein [Alphaproteobacteria bacterium]